jgi:hypothetical protein
MIFIVNEIFLFVVCLEFVWSVFKIYLLITKNGTTYVKYFHAVN